jgi:plasmid maintenance system antidote protein VapI
MTMTRTVIDGVEFFVNIKTGEVGISISGLARLCGVTQQALSKLIQRLEILLKSQQKSVTTKTPP